VFALGDSVVFGALTMTGTPSNPQTTYWLYRLGPSGQPVQLLSRTLGNVYPQHVIATGNNALIELGSLDFWVTNGTAAGTTPLGINGLYVEFTGAVLKQGGVAWFFAQVNPGTGNMGYDLWRTDGTVAGTRQFADVDTMHPQQEMVYFNGRPYFTHHYIVSPVLHNEMWTSDGTSGGTVAVISGTSNVSGLLVSGGRLFFTAMEDDFSFDPWVSNGTAAGTQQLHDLGVETITEDSGVEMLGSLGSTMFFIAGDGVHGTELWATDGTSAGTRMVRDIVPGSAGNGATGLVAMNGFALISADDGVHGYELWRTDGTEAGTFMVKDIQPGSNTSGVSMTPLHSVRLGGYVYFMADDGVTGREVWRTDGTEAGTTRVTDLLSGDFAFAYLLPHVVNLRLFVLTQDNGGYTVWSGDGSGAPFVSLTNAAPEGIDTAAVFQDRLCWLGWDSSFNSEIYCSNGMAGSVQAITDFTARGLDAIGPVFAVNGRLLVDVYGASTAHGGLYASDGTIASLEKISDLHFGGGGVYLGGGARYVAHPGGLYAGNDLMVTDGTAAGTRLFLPANVPAPDRMAYRSFGVFDD
jgi:ELWxxDGT repeat protein